MTKQNKMPVSIIWMNSQATVFQVVDNIFHQINLYPLDSAIGFPKHTYPPDSDLSSW